MEGNYNHKAVVNKSAAKTPRAYTDDQKNEMRRASIFQAMQMENGLN